MSPENQCNFCLRLLILLCSILVKSVLSGCTENLCTHLPMKTSGLSIKDRIMSERDFPVKPLQSSGGGRDEQAEYCSWRWKGLTGRHSDRDAAAVGEVLSAAAVWMNSSMSSSG